MTLSDRISKAVSRENLEGHLEWFSKVRRDTGGPGEEAAASYIADTLRSYGVPVVVHEFDAFLSYPREAVFEVTSPEKFSLDALTHSFAKSTPDEGVSGTVVVGTADDLESHRGEIVLIDGLCTPATVLAGSRAGVKALIFANQDRVIHNMIATTIWGTPTPDQLHRLPQIPVVSIHRQGGDRIKAAMETGPVEVRLQTRVETGWYRSKLPEVRIEGREDPDTFTLVGGHYCSWEYGITDNATGDAVLLEMARILHDNKSDLNRSVRICWWPGHSHGRYSGSTWYADTFFKDLADHAIAYHNIDSPGVRGATKYVARHTTAEIEAFCVESIASMTGQTDPPIHRPSRAADQSFLANGVPSFSCYPFLPDDHPDRRPWTGGCANALWWHSSEDTLDKADLNILELDTRISTTAVARLSTMRLLPIDPSHAAQGIAEFASELHEALQGEHDDDELVRVANVFSNVVGELVALESDVREADAEEYNAALMRVCRTTVPLTYSKGGRFTHDPAAWSPIMRNTRTSVFPGLNDALALDALEGDARRGFVLASVRRQINRAVDELEVATEACKRSIERLRSSAIPS